MINGTDRHDKQEIAFNYFKCKHLDVKQGPIMPGNTQGQTSLATNNC